jgi:hypothetical protein
MRLDRADEGPNPVYARLVEDLVEQKDVRLEGTQDSAIGLGVLKLVAAGNVPHDDPEIR